MLSQGGASCQLQSSTGRTGPLGFAWLCKKLYNILSKEKPLNPRNSGERERERVLTIRDALSNSNMCFVLLVRFCWFVTWLAFRHVYIIMLLKRLWSNWWHFWSRSPDWIRTIWFCGESVFAPLFPTEIPAPRASRRLAMLGLGSPRRLFEM